MLECSLGSQRAEKLAGPPWARRQEVADTRPPRNVESPPPAHLNRARLPCRLWSAE